MQHIFDNANQIVIYAIYGMSLNVLLGYAGQLSVAHAAFGAVGGYLGAYLATAYGWGFLPVLLTGTAAAGVVGALASLPALYLDMRFLILLTLALATAILAVVGAIPALGEQTGLTALPLPSVFGNTLLQPSQFFAFALPVGLIVLLICWRLAHSPFGRVLRGIRDDELATRGIGKNVVRAKVSVFAITAAMAGTAGVMLAFYDSSIEPSSYDLSQSLQIIAIVVIGGTANLIGSILGAAVLVLLTPFLQNVVNISPDNVGLARLAIYGTLIVIFMLVLPQGLLREGWTPARLLGRLRRGGRTPDSGRARSNRQQAALAELATNNGDGKPAEGRVLLEATGLSKHFGGIRAAHDLDLQLRSGQVTGLIGPNGAGKTTVFNLLTRAIVPDSGTVVLGDRVLGDRTPDQIALAGMCRSYQDVRIFDRMSVLDNVVIAAPGQPGEKLLDVLLRPLRVRRFERQARARALEHLQFVGLAERADELAGSLSFGDQKLLALARLLATEADVLLLDEPASGIDIDGVEQMLDAIKRLRESGKCVCIVEHNLHVVERVADRVYFMEAGQITAEGTMSDLMAQKRLAEVYFGGA